MKVISDVKMTENLQGVFSLRMTVPQHKKMYLSYVLPAKTDTTVEQPERNYCYAHQEIIFQQFSLVSLRK